MRLAYHEKAVAELAEARGVDDRIDEMNQLLRRLEYAGQSVRGEHDTVVDQLERIASRMDSRLQQLETTTPSPRVLSHRRARGDGASRSGLTVPAEG